MAKTPGRKSDRELDREVRDTLAAESIVAAGDVHSSLLPGCKDYEIVARAVPAARVYRPGKWTKPDQEALSRVLAYARGFAANRGLLPTYPRLIASGDIGRSGYVYHSLESRNANDPHVATFSSYDRAREAEAIARQAALEIGIVVPGMEGMEKKRARRYDPE
jgi:hypothetical protein